MVTWPQSHNSPIFEIQNTLICRPPKILYLCTVQLIPHCVISGYQAIPGNDQIASPTNQKTAGSKLKRTS